MSLNMLMNKTLPWKEERDRFSSRIIIMSKPVKLYTVPSDVGKLTELGADDEIVAIFIPRMNNFAAGSLISLQYLSLQIGFVIIPEDLMVLLRQIRDLHAHSFDEGLNKTTQQLYKVSTPCIDDHHFKEEEMKSVGELSQVCSQIVLKCLYLARIGRPDILWSVNKLARSITKWTKACDKRLNRLISKIHHTCEYKQYCHV